MLEKVWDVYANNCFVQRVHYAGYVGKVVTKWRDKGFIVRVEEKEINF